jgi:hypothetical protein
MEQLGMTTREQVETAYAEWQGAVEDVQEKWRNGDPLASEESWARWLEVRDFEEQARMNLDVAVDEYRGLSD